MAQKNRLRILAGKVATREIMEAVVGAGRVQYKDLTEFASVSSINQRLRELENCGLIEHHMTREEKREEWYTPTEAGKKFRTQLEAMDELDEELPGE
jgi:DNA-binding HxlR family transcriptional regulator